MQSSADVVDSASPSTVNSKSLKADENGEKSRQNQIDYNVPVDCPSLLLNVHLVRALFV